MSGFTAPEVPRDVYIQQGWREMGGGMWFKADGSPVFFGDIVKAHKPLADWVREMVKIPEPTLSDFEETHL